MATTPVLGMTLPTVGGDSNAWGGELNANLSILDTLFAGQLLGTEMSIPIGNGCILKVGRTGSIVSGASATVTFATAFPNFCRAAFVAPNTNALVGNVSAGVAITDKTAIVVSVFGNTFGCYWAAVGN